AAAFAVDQHNAASAWNFNILKNGGKPSGAFMFEPGDSGAGLTEEQVAEIKAQIAEEQAGVGNAGRHLLLQGGWKYQSLGLSAKDIDWHKGKELSALEIAQVYEVPAPLLHLQGSMTYSNFREARMHLYEDAVLPLLKLMLAELNNWLTPLFGDDLTLDYDGDAISALSPRRESVWARIQNADFLTVNEKRAAVGFEAIDGGDVVVIPGVGD
ncbi:MAG: phage portal protein, partial [Sphingomonadales bacterium]